MDPMKEAVIEVLLDLQFWHPSRALQPNLFVGAL